MCESHNLNYCNGHFGGRTNIEAIDGGESLYVQPHGPEKLISAEKIMEILRLIFFISDYLPKYTAQFAYGWL